MPWQGDSSAAPTGAAGGDLSGTFPNPSVATVGGTAAETVAANLPSAGQKAALAGSDGTPGSGNKYVTQEEEICIAVLQFGHIPADNQYAFCKIPVGWKVSALKARASNAGVAGTFTATKDTDGTAPAAGTTQLDSSFAATSIAAANTLYSFSLTATAADLVHTLAAHILCVKAALLDIGDASHGCQVYVFVKRV